MKKLSVVLFIVLAACNNNNNKDETTQNENSKDSLNQVSSKASQVLSGIIEGKKYTYVNGIANIKRSDPNNIRFFLGSNNSYSLKCDENGDVVNSYANEVAELEAAMDSVSFKAPINASSDLIQGSSQSVPDISFQSFVGHENGNGTSFPAKTGKVSIKKITDTEVTGYIEAGGDSKETAVAGDFIVKLCKPRN